MDGCDKMVKFEGDEVAECRVVVASYVGQEAQSHLLGFDIQSADSAPEH